MKGSRDCEVAITHKSEFELVVVQGVRSRPVRQSRHVGVGHRYFSARAKSVERAVGLCLLGMAAHWRSVADVGHRG